MATRVYRHELDAWSADRLLDIFQAVAVGAGIKDKARVQYIDDAHMARMSISRLCDPLAFARKPAELERKASEQARRDAVADTAASSAAYVRALDDGGGFSSLGQLRNAISGLNRVIKEGNDDAH